MESCPVFKASAHPLVWLLAIACVATVIAILVWPRPDRDCTGFQSAWEQLPETSSAFLSRPDGRGVVILYQPEDDNVFSHHSLVLLRTLHQQLEARMLYAEDTPVLRVYSLSNTYISLPDQSPQRLELLIPEPVPIGAGVLNALANRASEHEVLVWQLFSPDWSYGTLNLQTEPMEPGADSLLAVVESLQDILESEPYASHFSFYLLTPAELQYCPD